MKETSKGVLNFIQIVILLKKILITRRQTNNTKAFKSIISRILPDSINVSYVITETLRTANRTLKNLLL